MTNRVLIVDDELMVTDGLVSLLRLEDIDAEGANDRESAEALIAAEFFPLIVADLRLRSEEDGMMLLESIRRISPASRVATLTGYATEEIETRLRELGSSVVLHKPIGWEEIVSILTELLGEIESAAAIVPPSALDLDALYATTKRVLYSIPQKRYGLTQDESEELVQQAWCLFLEKRQSISHATAWLSGTVANLCKQQIQKNVRRRERISDDTLSPEIASTRASSDVTVMVWNALERVDPRSRDLCVLIGMEGLSYEEVSSRLGIALGSVGPLYIRAKERLRKALSN